MGDPQERTCVITEGACSLESTAVHLLREHGHGASIALVDRELRARGAAASDSNSVSVAG